MRSPKRMLAASTLTLEAFVVFFAALVAKDLSSLSVPAAIGGGAAIAVACLLVAGLLRLRVGYLLGSVLQLVLVGTGFWVPLMFFVGALFAALWAVSLYWGARIEREQAIVAAGLADRATPAP
jgi:Protein of unknown function (DUF4233)